MNEHDINRLTPREIEAKREEVRRFAAQQYRAFAKAQGATADLCACKRGAGIRVAASKGMRPEPVCERCFVNLAAGLG